MTWELSLDDDQLDAVLAAFSAAGVPVIDPSTPEGRSRARALYEATRREATT
jgi:hypothetical protein